MNYAILIYESASDFTDRTDPQKQAEYWAQWPVYTKTLKDAGAYVAGAGLQPPETGTTLRFETGRRLVLDGPFAETKEQLGGFYIVSAPDLDAALDWAGRVPRWGGRAVEVRPCLGAGT